MEKRLEQRRAEPDDLEIRRRPITKVAAPAQFARCELLDNGILEESGAANRSDFSPYGCGRFNRGTDDMVQGLETAVRVPITLPYPPPSMRNATRESGGKSL